MTSKSSDVQSISIEFGHCVNVCFIFAEQFDDVVVSFVAGEMKRGPIIERLMVDKCWIAVLSFFYELFGFVILSFFAVLS